MEVEVFENRKLCLRVKWFQLMCAHFLLNAVEMWN